jgi:CubicO group peptidase (beta-lactamase class C family)
MMGITIAYRGKLADLNRIGPEQMIHKINFAHVAESAMLRIALSIVVLFFWIGHSPAQETKIPVSGDAIANLAPFDDMMLKFMSDNQVPGASLAVARNGKLIYARGFGYADEKMTLGVQPNMRFRIASISKPITGVMILRLIEMGLLKLSDNPFAVLKAPLPEDSDPRLRKITIEQLLHHTAGWDREASFDPMFRPLLIAKEEKVDAPAKPNDIIHYMTRRKLDFDPGTRYAYSNFGYCILGRVIEKTTGQSYEAAVHKYVFEPIGVKQTQLGKTLTPLKNEVHYFDRTTGRAVLGPDLGKFVARPYGAWYLEAMDAHGGWISTAADLVRFAAAFDQPERCTILKAESIQRMFTPPKGILMIKKEVNVGYGCGWVVRKVGNGKINTWHMGALDGTATVLVRRADGLSWAVLFNSRFNAKGVYLGNLIDPLVHLAANEVKRWPN